MISILVPASNCRKIDAFVAEIHRILPKAQIIVQEDNTKRGKGWALRKAFDVSSGEIVAFIDGDGDIPPRMLLRLLPFIEDFDVVVGSKRMTGAPLHRKIITHLSRIYIRIMFGLQIETQTGIKIFRREALGLWDIDGFACDIEILAKAQKKGFNMIEVPIEVEIKSNMTLGVVWKTLMESLRIKYRLLCHAGR